MAAVDKEAFAGNGEGEKTSNDVTRGGGGWGGADPPSAVAYDSEKERLAGLAPKTNEDILMEKRKQTVKKMIEKKPVMTLDPRKRYEERKEERIRQRQAAAVAAAASLEAAKGVEERRRMALEEQRTWDAYELNTRNHMRMIEQEKKDREAAAEKLRQERGNRLAREEEGLTFDHGIVVGHRRWRASPALAAVLPAHPCPVHTMRQSANGRWILSGGDEHTVRLWDTEAFARKVGDTKSETRAAAAVTRIGAVAADLALGWECANELVGHTAAVRDVEFNPLFGAPPEYAAAEAGRAREGWQGGTQAAPQGQGRGDAGRGGVAMEHLAPVGGGRKRGAGGKVDGGEAGGVLPGEERATAVKLGCMLASASADSTVRIWDLSFNPRIARFVLRGHKGVVYACRFAPSGDRLASCSADGTVRMWNVLNGTNVYCYEGHTSPVISLCYSPSGRYLVSCSDIGERAIRVWFAGMPLYDRRPVPLGLRLRWARSGLIKRVRVKAEPSAIGFFLNRQEDRESRESSDESAGEKEYKERLKIPRTVLTQADADPCPSQAVSNGFSLTVTILNDSGKDTRTEEYYRGCKLVLRARALKKFTGLYVAGVSAEGLWEGYEAKGGCRYGAFFRDVPEGMSLSAGRSIAAGKDINRTEKGANEVVLRWKANSRAGVGWLTFRAVFRFPTTVAGKLVLGRETVWVTLRERPPPTPAATYFAATRLKPRKRNFDTVGRTGLFVGALKTGDWTEATMMLSAAAKLEFGKVKATGAAEVANEIRKILGRNIIVHDGRSVGVAWTSVCVSHEPLGPPKEEPPATAAPMADPPPPSSPFRQETNTATAPESPASAGTAAVTVVGARAAAPRKNGNSASPIDSDDSQNVGKESRRKWDQQCRLDGSPEKKKRRKARGRKTGGGGGAGGGSGVGDGADRRENGGIGGSGEKGTQCQGRQQRSRRGQRQRPQSLGACSPRASTPSRGRSWGRIKGGASKTDRSSGEEETAAVRASVQKAVRAELAQLRRLKAASVASWKELGKATGLLSLAKARRRNKGRARGESKGLLDAVGITVPDPKVDLKVLVWDGAFGADVKEMRMPLPELYPSLSTTYDQNEDFAARTLEEAIAIGDRSAPALMKKMRDDKRNKTDHTVGKMVDAVLDREEQLRRVGTRRRDAIVRPSDLAVAFPVPDPRLAPLRHHPLIDPKKNIDHDEKGEDRTTVASAEVAGAAGEHSALLGDGGHVEEQFAGSRNQAGVLTGAQRVTKKEEIGCHGSPSAATAPGTLLLRAEGSPRRGLSQKGIAVTIAEKQSQEELVKGNKDNVGEEGDYGLSTALAGNSIDDKTSAVGEAEATALSAAATATAGAGHILPPLEPYIMHSKLEGTASREMRQKEEQRLARQPPPVDPPGDVDLARRRGGLGMIPGGASLVEVPTVGDWEKQIARENGGLLRQLETRFSGVVCHQDAVNAVAYSPDGRRLASASSDGTIKLWDPSGGKQVRLLTGHHEGMPVWDVAWSGDSIFLVSCGADRSLVIWNTAATEPFVRRFLGHSDHVTRCAFAGTRGEAVLSCGNDGTIRKWVLTPNVPAPPPKPYVTHKTRTWVMLNWRPAAGSNEQITAYVVSWRLGRKGKFDDELTVAGDQLRRDVTGLLPGSLYFFRVAGVNRMGQGPWSELTDMVDTEMDLPLAMDRPNTEAVTPESITISFFAPRPTLPKMKIQRFVLQAKGGGLDFDESVAQEFSWDEAMAGGAALRGKERGQAKAREEAIISAKRAQSGQTALGMSSDPGSDGSAGTVRRGSSSNAAEAAGDGGDVGSGGCMDIGELGRFTKAGVEIGPGTAGTAAADGTLDTAAAQVGGSDERRSVGGLSSSAKNGVELGSTAVENGGASGPDSGTVDSELNNQDNGNENRNKNKDKDNSNDNDNDNDDDQKDARGDGSSNNTGNNKTTGGGVMQVQTGVSSLSGVATKERGSSAVQSGQATLVRRGKFVRSNTRKWRDNQKMRRNQRHRRKAHHHLMSLTYSGLRPGTDYHIQVAGISSVGQGPFSLPTYSARTPAVRPHACPPPTASKVFLTAVMISWTEGDDGGSAVTGFIVRPTGGGELEEVPVSRTRRTHLFENLEKGHSYTFQVRAVNNEGTGPWSEPSPSVRTLTQRPSAPPPPALSVAHPPPGPLSLWLSLYMPSEDGGDPITAMLLETRRHGGTQPPEWFRCDRHPLPPSRSAKVDGKRGRNGTADTTTFHSGGATGGGESGAAGKAGDNHGHRRVGGAGGAGGDPAAARKVTAFCEIVVLVDGLQPLTYYSFRASAVNSQGTGDPGPPCRRIRTAAPSPPSWVRGNDYIDARVAAALQPVAGGMAQQSDGKIGSEGLAAELASDGVADAATRTSCAPPRAACSGLGACTVLWEEPFSNGAAIKLYAVEILQIGPEVIGMDAGVIIASKAGGHANGDDDPAATAAAAAKVEAAGAAPTEEGNAPDEVKTSSAVSQAGDQQPRDVSELSPSMSPKQEEAIAAPPPPPPPEVVVLPVSDVAGRGSVVREVMKKLTRSVPSHMRHLVVRGLATGGDYVFRVAASNASGMGEPGPWTQVVRVVEPANED